MNTHGWLDGDDPWLTQRMRDVAGIAEAETEIGIGTLEAVTRFLAIARAAILGEPAPRFATEPEQQQPPPPDLDAWPPQQVWLDLLAVHVIPRVRDVFGGRFTAQALDEPIDDSRWSSAYLEEVFDRLRIWPDGAFEEIRFELLEGMAQGEDNRQLRARVGRVLDIDARSREAQADIREQTKIIEDPGSSDAERKRARATRAALYRSQDIADAQWQWKAARIARTETMGAWNGGTYAGAQAYQAATGRQRFKQWWSTTDNRTRDSHWAAHMQVQPLIEPFSVGGFALDHPGQAGGPGHEVINCRCSLLILSPAEAAQQQERYAELRPERRTIKGDLMDDAGQPIGTDQGQFLAKTPDQAHLFSSRTTLQEPDTQGDDPMTTPAPVAPPDTAQPAAPDARPLPVGWRGILAPVNKPSADYRMLLLGENEQPQHRPLPIAIKYQDEQWGGHDGAFGVGLATKIWREGDNIWGSGPFDLNDPRAADVARKVGDGYQGWISLDLDPPRLAEYRWYQGDSPCDGPMDDAQEVESYADWRISSATLVMDAAFPEAKVWPVYDVAELVPVADLPQAAAPALASGGVIELAVVGDVGLPFAPREHPWDEAAARARVAEWAGGVGSLDADRFARAFLYRDPDGDPGNVGSYKLGFADLIDGELRAVFRAIGQAAGRLDQTQIAASDLGGVKARLRGLYESAAKAFDDPTISAPSGLTASASAIPLAAPAAWFMYPEFDGPTRWTVLDDGRCFGHIGLHEGVAEATPHLGWLMAGRRIFAPNNTRFTRHNSKPYRVAEGYDIAVGCMVINTDHAPTDPWTTAAMAADHYANTGFLAAYGRAGKDQWGDWFAGVLAPGLTPEQFVTTKAMSLSGDWREIDGEVQLICALGCNIEALHTPIPRQLIGEDGRILALTAACPVPANYTPVTPPAQVVKPTTRYIVADPVEFARALIAEDRAQREREAEAARLYARMVGAEIDKLAARMRPMMRGKR